MSKDTSITPEEMADIQKEARLRIIQSLLQNGLLSVTEQRKWGFRALSSADGISDRLMNQYVHLGVLFNSSHTHLIIPQANTAKKVILNENHMHVWDTQLKETNQVFTSMVVKRVLYGDDFSVLPVIVERESQDTLFMQRNLSPRVIEDRLANSLVLVVTTEDLTIAGVNRGSARVLSHIPPDYFKAALIPETLSELIPYLENSGVKVSAVPFVHPVFPSDSVFRNNDYQVPDYETAVVQEIIDSPIPLLVHGIRLPTLEDVATLRI